MLTLGERIEMEIIHVWKKEDNFLYKGHRIATEKGYKGSYFPDSELIVIYHPNNKNSLDLFLTYCHELLHYISSKFPRVLRRIVWVYLDGWKGQSHNYSQHCKFHS